MRGNGSFFCAFFNRDSDHLLVYLLYKLFAPNGLNDGISAKSLQLSSMKGGVEGVRHTTSPLSLDRCRCGLGHGEVRTHLPFSKLQPPNEFFLSFGSAFSKRDLRPRGMCPFLRFEQTGAQVPVAPVREYHDDSPAFPESRGNL